MKANARVIVNPTSGYGFTGMRWPRIHRALVESGLAFDYVRTEHRGHAMELAEEAARAGYGMVIAVGGDGTVNEVVNGLMKSGKTNEVMMGILNTGTGCDFARFLGISRNYRQSCLHLAHPRTIKADVGVVECFQNGEPVSRFFISAAGLGFDGMVVETASRGPKFVRGAVPYFFGVLRSLGAYRNVEIHLHIDGQRQDARICSVVIANGGFYGAGMRIAPDADLQDGLFEVLVIGDLSKLELVQAFPRAYLGTHVTHPKVRMEKASSVDVESEERILIQADGELVGEGPARFRVLPSALTIAL